MRLIAIAIVSLAIGSVATLLLFFIASFLVAGPNGDVWIQALMSSKGWLFLATTVIVAVPAFAVLRRSKLPVSFSDPSQSTGLPAKRATVLAIAFLCGLLALGALFLIVASSDPAIPGAKAFVAHSPRVTSLVGGQVAATVTRVEKVSGSVGKASFTEYRIVAKGEKGSALLAVRATGPDSTGSWEYQLQSIEALN